MLREPSLRMFASFMFVLPGVVACQQEVGTAPAAPPPEVEVIRVVPKTIPDDVEFIGQTESFRPVEIRSQVTGIIKKVFFTEGRNVRKGDKLYLIDPVPFKAVAGSAKGQVGQAVARVSKSSGGIGPSQAVAERTGCEPERCG